MALTPLSTRRRLLVPLLPLLLVVFFFFTSESVSTAARSEWDLRNFEPGREERDDLAICKFETRIAYAFKNNKDNPNIGVHKSDDACECCTRCKRADKCVAFTFRRNRCLIFFEKPSIRRNFDGALSGTISRSDEPGFDAKNDTFCLYRTAEALTNVIEERARHEFPDEDPKPHPANITFDLFNLPLDTTSVHKPSEDLVPKIRGPFFVLTSQSPKLTPHARCAIESAVNASLLHNVPIRLYSSTITNETLTRLGLHPPAIAIPFTYEEAFSGTRLESWFHKWRGVHDELAKLNAKGAGKIRTALSHLSDALRLALLWKYAGTYLDTDIITLRDDILRLPNAVGYQKPFGTDYLNGACFNVIIPRHPFIKALIDIFVDEYNFIEYAKNGPQAIHKAYEKTCASRLNLGVKEKFLCTHQCGIFPWDIVTFPSNAFYPITHTGPRAAALYSTTHADQTLAELERYEEYGSFTLHLWHSKFSKKPFKQGSLLEEVMKKRCPNTHAAVFRAMDRKGQLTGGMTSDIMVNHSSQVDCFCQDSCGFDCNKQEYEKVKLFDSGENFIGPRASAAPIFLNQKTGAWEGSCSQRRDPPLATDMNRQFGNNTKIWAETNIGGQDVKSKASGKESSQVVSNSRDHLKQFLQEKLKSGGSSS